MKKIVILSHSLGNGGSQRVASIIANYFSKNKYKVIFIAAHSDEVNYKIESDVKYLYIGKRIGNKLFNFFARLVRLFKIIKIEKPDIVISFIYEENIALLPFRKVKKIYTMRNAPEYFGKYQFALMKFLYDKCNCVIFQTEDAKKSFSKKVQEHSVVIPNPITESLPKWDRENNSKRVICACRLDEQKNLKMLIDGFSNFHEEFPDYKLVIYGKGPQKEELEEYISENNFGEYIELAGFTENIHKEMANSEIFVLTSNYEGISNSMIEALGIGLPCICTDCPIGGARMLIENKENGILIPVNDVEALQSSLKLLATDKELVLRLSKNSKKINDELSQSKICSEWEKIIMKVSDKNGA